MRTGLTFSCTGETLCATLDKTDGETGLLIVTGGRQTRVGPHRMMATLAAELAAEGVSVFRFDRRGVGDSGGTDPGFANSTADIFAAMDAFRTACPQLQTIWGLGLCDGASALALHGRQAALDGLILLNPWVIEATADAPPPEAIRAHYRDQLITAAGWRKLLTQGISLSSVFKDLKASARKSDQGLARAIIGSLAAFSGPKHILIAERDATARAFISLYNSDVGKPLKHANGLKLIARDSGSHSFASPADHRWLTAQVIAALRSG